MSSRPCADLFGRPASELPIALEGLGPDHVVYIANRIKYSESAALRIPEKRSRPRCSWCGGPGSEARSCPGCGAPREERIP